MAAKSQPSKILCSIILSIVSSIPRSLSQSTFPQNIQTYYPISSPPPPSPPPPLPTPQPSSPPRSSSTRAAVGKAIGVTAATTLVLSGLLFFLLLRYSNRKRVRHTATISPNPTTAAPVNHADNFSRFNGNLKGVIVDENGLDVLYWRNLESGEKRTSFNKQYYKLTDDQKEEEKRTSGEKGKKNEAPSQEIPLLRGKSSTSQCLVWGEKEARMINKAPTLSSEIDFKAENIQDSSDPVSETVPQQPEAPAAATSKKILASASVPKGKMPAPTTPLPMPPPPLGKGSAPHPPPPPPPPMPSNKGSAPPPPPPPSIASSASSLPATKGVLSKSSSSVGEGSSSNGNGQVKLKPLHWDKVNPDVKHSMVWDNIDKGSFKFDGDMMEALFGYVATNRKSLRGDGTSSTPKQDKSVAPPKIFILDKRKSQNTAIVIKSLGITSEDIIGALIEGRGLNTDTLEKLVKVAPTDEEMSGILAFDGDPAHLADAESFLYRLLHAVPLAFTRFNSVLFKSTYDLEVSQIKGYLQTLDSACKELRTRGLFLKLLEAVLKAGNRLNAGTSRGNAQAFNLTALRKLSIIGGLSSEFSNVKKSAALDYDLLVKTVSSLAEQVVETRKVVAQCRDNGGFAQEMAGFLDAAELEIQVVKEEQRRVVELVKKTTDYYQAGFSKEKGTNILQLFVIVKDFLGMVDQVCVEIARNIQKKNPISSSPLAPIAGSSSAGSPRVFRFPFVNEPFLESDKKKA